MLIFVIYGLLILTGLQSWVVVQSFIFYKVCFWVVLCNCFFFMGSVGLSMGIDSVSYILILLSFWSIALVVSGSHEVQDSGNFPSLFLSVNILLLLSLVLTFCCLDYLIFYVCFESSLIPTLILILGWRYQPERLQAGLYMLFYTLFAYLPLLVSLISLYKSEGILGQVSIVEGPKLVLSIWYVCTVFTFIIKLPIFMVHVWLPKAHVKAPAARSIILAEVLLKLSGYGLIRVLHLFAVVSKGFVCAWVRTLWGH